MSTIFCRFRQSFSCMSGYHKNTGFRISFPPIMLHTANPIHDIVVIIFINADRIHIFPYPGGPFKFKFPIAKNLILCQYAIFILHPSLILRIYIIGDKKMIMIYIKPFSVNSYIVSVGIRRGPALPTFTQIRQKPVCSNYHLRFFYKFITINTGSSYSSQIIVRHKHIFPIRNTAMRICSRFDNP